MKNALMILNYPLQNQINVGHLDLLKIQFENMLNIFDEVHVISPRDRRKYNLKWVERIKIHSTGCDSKSTYYLSPLADLIYALNLIKTKNIKVIRALAPSSGFVAVLASKFTKIPAIISIHTNRKLVAEKESESKLKHFLLKLIIGWTYRNATKVLSISKHVAKTICEESGLPLEKIFIHHNFVDTDLFKPISHKNKIQILIWHGRLVKAHGVDSLIRALPKILSKRKVVLKICGDGPERNNLEKLVKEFGVSEQVIFAGRLNHDKVLPEVLANADLFVSPSLSGFSLIEALSCGLPVVAADVEWSREVINKDVGMLVPPNNSEKLTEGVLELLSSKFKMEKFRKHARMLAVERFSLNAWKQREKEVYNHVLSR